MQGLGFAAQPDLFAALLLHVEAQRHIFAADPVLGVEGQRIAASQPLQRAGHSGDRLGAHLVRLLLDQFLIQHVIGVAVVIKGDAHMAEAAAIRAQQASDEADLVAAGQQAKTRVDAARIEDHVVVDQHQQGARSLFNQPVDVAGEVVRIPLNDAKRKAAWVGDRLLLAGAAVPGAEHFNCIRWQRAGTIERRQQRAEQLCCARDHQD